MQFKQDFQCNLSRHSIQFNLTYLMYLNQEIQCNLRQKQYKQDFQAI